MIEDKPSDIQHRLRMVDSQIEPRGVMKPEVLDAMRQVPRHAFVSPTQRHVAYDDGPQVIGHGQTISQPYIVALMTEQLDIEPAHDVLEIGTGCGYQTAILAHLARAVYTVELLPELADQARQRLDELGHTNIQYHVGNGREGWPEPKQFDRILVAAAAEAVPDRLASQLKDGGKMVIPVGGEDNQQLMLVEKQGAGLQQRRLCYCRFVRLLAK